MPVTGLSLSWNPSPLYKRWTDGHGKDGFSNCLVLSLPFPPEGEPQGRAAVSAFLLGA